jgi:GDP-L-fucose synthase
VATPLSRDARIYVAGHRGMAGSAIVRRLKQEGFHQILTATSSEVDLRDQRQTASFFEQNRPEAVFLAAAKVGGIWANMTYPADFIYDNLAIQTNVIEASRTHGVDRLVFLGSSCIYPRMAPQPIKEDSLLTGPLEPTNQPYALAKIAGVEMCQAYSRQHGLKSVCLMPTNLYGPGDNYHLETSHVMAALIRKFHEAKISGEPVVLWGSGSPLREFLYVDDLADAALFLANSLEGGELVNVGTGSDVSIRELAGLVQRIIGGDSEIQWDASKPDGTPRKLLDVSKVNSLGWRAKVPLEEGIARAYEWYLQSLRS